MLDGNGSNRDAPVGCSAGWHSYALNPRWYTEDSIRIHPNLKRTKEFPLVDIANLIDASSLQLVHTQHQIKEWETRSKTPFDPLLSLREATTRSVVDPFDGTSVIVVPFVTESGTGYSQQGFEAVRYGEDLKFVHPRNTGSLETRKGHSSLQIRHE